MKRTTLQWLSLTAAAAVLTAGCAAGVPERRPGGAGAGAGDTASSTTGDADACAAALGNLVGTGDVGYTGGGVGPNATAGAPAGPAAGPTGRTGVVGMTATDNMGTRHEVTANGVMIGNVALVALPTADEMPLSPATTPGGTAAPGTAGGPNTDALTRIRTACVGLKEIRVVTDAKDRASLARVTMAIRKGEPITNFMDDLSGMARRASAMETGAGTTGTPAPAPGR